MIRYDFQKCTILTLGLVAISLSVGLLLQYAHGQDNSTEEASKNAKEILCKKYYECETNNSTDNGCFTLGDKSRCILN
jgi:hypothetical protein